MHPRIDAAASVLSATSAEGSLELRHHHQQQQQPVHGAASSSPPPPSGGTHADGGGSPGGGIIRCQDCWLLAMAGCAHHRCPAHVPASSPCSERQQVLTALAATVAAAPSRKRPLGAVATPTTTTSSSVGHPAAAVPERFAREVNLDAVVFRRVWLGPDDAEVAYHATVTIGGHVFRGILYDVGPRSRRRRATASTDTGGSSDGSSLSTAAGGGLDLTLRL